MNTTLNGIDLTDSALWTNEFDNAELSRTVKNTVDGRKYVFQKRKSKNREPIIDCGWLLYSDVVALATLRDNGDICPLVLKDGRTLNVQIDSIEAKPMTEYDEYQDTDEFSVILKLVQV